MEIILPTHCETVARSREVMEWGMGVGVGGRGCKGLGWYIGGKKIVRKFDSYFNFRAFRARSAHPRTERRAAVARWWA